MRLLYARCGTVHCIHCDGLVGRDSVDEIAETILALPEGTRLHAIFPVRTQAIETKEDESPKPVRRGRKPTPKLDDETNPQSALSEAMKKRLIELRANGFNRLYQRAQIFGVPPVRKAFLDVDFSLPVFVLVDRIVASPENRARLVDAAEIAYREGGAQRNHLRRGSARRTTRRDGARKVSLFNRLRVPQLPSSRREPEPRLFLFQQPLRRLPALSGLRQHHRLRPEPDRPR